MSENDKVVWYQELRGWHWYKQANGDIVVCGRNKEACERVLKEMGYEIRPAY